MNKLGKIILDSSCLIALEKLDSLDLLPKLSSTVIIPEAVQREVGLELSWAMIKAPSPSSLADFLYVGIGKGETEAIILALEEEKKTLLILDDWEARKIAKKMGLYFTGTLGLLLEAKKAGLIPQIKIFLDGLKKMDFYFDDSLYQKILQQAGEQ